MRLKIKKILVIFVRLIYRFLFNNIVAGMPLNAVRSLIEVVEVSTVREHIVESSLFRDAMIECYNFPKEYPKYFQRKKAFDARYVYKLKNVVVSPHSGLCWIKEGKVFIESVGSIQRIMGWGANLLEISCARRLTDTSNVVCFPDAGYFHWLLEALPVIIYVKHLYPAIKILTTQEQNKYHKEVLEILFKDEIYENIIRSNAPLKIENYILPSMEPYSGFITKFEIGLLRKTFLPMIKVPKGENKIYISRSRTKKRMLSNEIKLEKELENLCFEIIHMGTITFLQQVETIHNADIIIAPHGAGLANLSFAKERSKVLEIFPHHLYNDCFARLAMNIGLKYTHMRCGYDKNSAGIIPINEVLENTAQL